MREFNTSGPNIAERHYTIERTGLIAKGLDMVAKERYFTIWAPRQTGKSTYFGQLAEKLREANYKVAHVNFENYRNAPIDSFLNTLTRHIFESWGLDIRQQSDISSIFESIQTHKTDKSVLIIDEVEGINPAYFGDFLHSIRNAYHSRHSHSLKSVILVGVSNIVGVVSDNASPFNIADNLPVPYFTSEEVYALLGQHESETGQRFDESVKQKIMQITAGQPGLVNGFARKLVEDYPDKPVLEMEDYLRVEHWYLNVAIDKNFANILNKAREERAFVERLLFTEDRIPFTIDRPSIKLLHTNGLIQEDEAGNVTFWVPFYKKRLYNAFYPYTNGEQSEIARTIYAPEYFTESGALNLDKLVATYKAYVRRRGFAPHMEKDARGNYVSIREAALMYSFETYIHAFITQTGGKIYREAQTGLGRSDMIININGQEYLIETKVYYAFAQFDKGKRQLAYYCLSLGLRRGVYLVFCPRHVNYPPTVCEQTEVIEGVEVSVFLVEYDEMSWK